MTQLLAVIGGTGFADITGFREERRESVVTPYGAPSAPLVYGSLSGQPIVTLQRHGERRHGGRWQWSLHLGFHAGDGGGCAIVAEHTGVQLRVVSQDER